MKPAARVTDPTDHGGTIVTGSPTVTINGLPVARHLDDHLCPATTDGTPHVHGPVIQGSATVFVNGRMVARQGDGLLCLCPADPEAKTEAGVAEKWKADPTKKVEKEGGDEALSKDEGKDKEKKYTTKVTLIDHSWAKDSGKLGTFAGEHGKVGAYDYDVKTDISAEFKSLHDAKLSIMPIDAKASASAVKLEAGGDGPVKGSVDLLHVEAEAKGGVLIDTKKSEYFAGVDGGIGGSVVEGKVSGETPQLRIPGTDWGISLEGEASGSALTAEAKGHVGAHYDQKDGFELNAGGKVGAALFGLGLSIGLKIKPIEKKKVSAQFDVIRDGSANVLIGG